MTSSASAPGALNASPATVSIASLGASGAQTVRVSESGYTGTFSESSSCGGVTPIASFSATSGSGPSWHLVITGINAGTCVATIGNTNGESLAVPITVSITEFTTQ